jgi:ROS/MUCR transcriptional regulator protein
VRQNGVQPFKTRREVERYFSGKTIECLLCGRRFRRLSFHLAAKHATTTDEYKSLFGLPWVRGLTSALSHARSGWTKKRKVKASKLARRTRFFKLAHPAPRRKSAAYLQIEAVRHLGHYATGFGAQFETRVWRLFAKGLTDAAIAQALKVTRTTVNRRTKHWRKKAGRHDSVRDGLRI